MTIPCYDPFTVITVHTLLLKTGRSLSALRFASNILTGEEIYEIQARIRTKPPLSEYGSSCNIRQMIEAMEDGSCRSTLCFPDTGLVESMLFVQDAVDGPEHLI